MKHRLFNFAAALSLLFCIVTVFLWVRSYWYSDAIRFGLRPACRYMMLYSGAGGLQAAGSFQMSGAQDFFRYQWEDSPEKVGTGNDAVFNRFGFGMGTEPVPPGAMYRFPNPVYCVWAPHWFVVLLLAILPIRWVILNRREIKRSQKGKCKTCGYDLRATPERCPECGTLVVQSA